MEISIIKGIYQKNSLYEASLGWQYKIRIPEVYTWFENTF
jgi:hypothetical protein